MANLINDNNEQWDTLAARLVIKKRSDRLINFFLAGYFLTGLILASFYDTWLIAIGIGGTSIIAYYSAKIALPASNLYQYVLGVVFGIFMAQYIYQMHGLFEMHFFAFIGSAILITYQNWKLQIPMLLVVLIHHALFGYLQNAGLGTVYFTQLDYFELRTFIIHLSLAAVIFFVCGLWGYQLKKYSELQIRQTMAMIGMQKEAILLLNAQKQQEERLKAQQDLAQSNQRFAYAGQATSDAVWDRDFTNDTILWGEGYHSLFGYEINEETSSIDFWRSKVYPDDFERINTIIEQAKNNPATNKWKCEYRFLKADGEYAFVRETAIVLRNEDGEPMRTIGALQDISEIKQTELILQSLNENLEKEKYFLDALMNNMPDSIYFKDEDSRLIRVSKYMAAQFNTTIDDLIGKSDFDFQDKEHASEAYEDEQEIQRTGKPKIDYIEKEITQKGTERWVSSSKMPLLNGRGEIVGTFGISRDITNIKKLEGDQHLAEIDKAVAQGKFEIASDVMHDIGNAVVGFGSYLTRMKRIQDRDNADNLLRLTAFFEGHRTGIQDVIGEAKASAVIKMLGSIAQSEKNAQDEICRSLIEQLNIIGHIQEILDIQRQHIAGNETRERKSVNIRNIINDSLAMVFAYIDKAAIAVSLSIPAEDAMIKGDRTKLMQLMLNLLKNSIESIDPDATEKSISIKSYSTGGRLVVEVKNSGNGFDKNTAELIFDRGFTTKQSGSGLGLYNCRSIIESHDGTLDVSSEGNGKGAVAKITFSV